MPKRAETSLGRGANGALLGGQTAPSLGLGAEPLDREREGGEEGRDRAWRVWRNPGLEIPSPPGWELEAREPSGRVRSTRGARGGGGDCGGAAGAGAGGVTGGGGGGAALAAATRPGRQTTPARGRARTARTLSKQCSEAPGGAPGGSETDGEAGGARPRGEPATLSPNLASFCLANVAAEGSFGGALRSPSGRPPVGVPRGDRRPLGEGGASGPRAPRVVPEVETLRPEDREAGGLFSIHSRIALFKTGKLSFEFREGKPTVLSVWLLCLGQEADTLWGLPVWRLPFLGSSIVNGAEKERLSGLPGPGPRVDGLGPQVSGCL